MNNTDGKVKKIAILGYGVEGQSVVHWLIAGGWRNLTVFEEKRDRDAIGKPMEFLDEHRLQFVFGPFPLVLSDFDQIIFSPGIRPDIPVLTRARKDKITVNTPTNIFMNLSPCPIVGVTGTKGKGTTSALITEMLKSTGRSTYLGGNIGTPPLDFLAKLTPQSYVVLEMSSFQLFSLTRSPQLSVILMVTSEHLDYHKDIDEYIKAKSGIVRYQNLQDVTVANCDYPNSMEVAALSAADPVLVSTRRELEEGCFVKGQTIVWREDGQEESIIDVGDIFIPGRHNWENAAAAAAAAKKLGIPIININRVLKVFPGLPHRLEFVRTVRGVKYYDDSFSTTPETAIAAIAAFPNPKVLVLGGSVKNSDFRDLGKIVSSTVSVRGIIGIGLEWPRIKKEIKNTPSDLKIIEGCKDMSEIISAARQISQPGDVVILTPACASFDMFKNYKDRGDQFKSQVNLLED